jgi:hypothetical protein
MTKKPVSRPARKQQIEETRACCAVSIMRHPHFARGLDDIRTGQPFADHILDQYLAYERGRLFGCVAPRSMPLFIRGRLNEKAVRLFNAAGERMLIL